MNVTIWVREGVWEAAVDAALAVAGPDAAFTLLHVISGDENAVIQGGFAGLFGRRHAASAGLDDVARQADAALLDAAAERLGRPATRQSRRGRIEQEVVLAADGVDLLIVSRDGDRRRLGPHSLGHATRFVVDHAPCAVLLVWPESAPAVSTIPPPPPPGAPPPLRPPHH